jgi:hypothetical protein
MKKFLKRSLTFAAITTVILGSGLPVFARGGAGNIMNSPGYQRRLQESRQQLPSSNVQPASTRHGHKARHHHQH